MREAYKAHTIECKLCRKPKMWDNPYQTFKNEISDWSKVCNDCVKLWELGKKTMSAAKSDGKDSEARVHLEVPTHAKMGDPLGSIEVRGKDIMNALGGVSLRGTEMGKMFGQGKREIVDISSPIDEKDNGYIGGGSLDFKVPKNRADAMKRVLAGFYNAIAKARVDGFNEGRNLLLGLSKGNVSLESFSEQADNARVGKKPRKRWDE